MAQHTQKRQNERSGEDPTRPEAEGRNTSDTDLGRDREGAQSGANRGPQFVPRGAGRSNVEPASAAHEGQTTTRTPEDDKQGITSHPASEESKRQQQVVKDRPDAQAGLNQNRR